MATPGFQALAARLAAPPPALARGVLVGLGLALAVASGFAAAGESLHAMIFVGACVALILVVVGIVRPRWLLALLLPHAILFPALPIMEGRGSNPIDILLPAALFSAWMFGSSRPAPAPQNAVFERARRAVVRGAAVYYAVAVLSLVLLALRGNVDGALDSMLVLSRSMQAALFFYVVSRHAHDRAGLLFVRNCVFAGFLIALVINLPIVTFGGVPRAGSVVVFGTPSGYSGMYWSVGGSNIVMTNPNELAAACLLVWALLLGFPPRRWLQVSGLVACFVLLLATLSRSGLLAWMTFQVVLGLRGGHRKLLLLPLLALAIIPFVPEDMRERFMRTLVMERGTFEVYTSLIRVFGWQAALLAFLDNPIFGVGYLGFRYIAQDYNTLGIILQTVENVFFEIAVSMGVVGIAALTAFAAACWRLGRLAERAAERGSIAWRLGRITPAFLIGIAAGNLTGDNLLGLLCGAQLAIFLAILAQAATADDCRRATPDRA